MLRTILDRLFHDGETHSARHRRGVNEHIGITFRQHSSTNARSTSASYDCGVVGDYRDSFEPNLMVLQRPFQDFSISLGNVDQNAGDFRTFFDEKEIANVRALRQSLREV